MFIYALIHIYVHIYHNFTDHQNCCTGIKSFNSFEHPALGESYDFHEIQVLGIPLRDHHRLKVAVKERHLRDLQRLILQCLQGPQKKSPQRGGDDLMIFNVTFYEWIDDLPLT